MGALFGQWIFDGATSPSADLDRMAASMRHRAPDGFRYRHDGPVAFGHGALPIYLEDRHDRQPVGDDAGTQMLVAECRLDNRADLARDLGIADDRLALMADSALILAAFSRWGEGCVARLLGDFAFAAWDRERGELILARDHMGQALLYYWLDDERLVFASESRALFALPFVPRVLDETEMAIQGARAGLRATQGKTLFKGIKGVVGGRYLVVSADGAVREEEYWRPAAGAEHLGRDVAYYIANYRALLAEAVACRSRRLIDPPGLLLSGGFDSSAIAAVAAAGLPPGHKLLAITSALPDGQAHRQSARPGASDCAAHMPHLDHEWWLTGRGALDDLTDLRLQVLDQPMIPGLNTPYLMLQRLRQRGARLVMDGICGDETINPRGANILADLIRAGRVRTALRETLIQARITGWPLRRIVRNRIVGPLIPHGWRLRWAMRRKTYSPYTHPYLREARQARLLDDGAIEPRSPVAFQLRKSGLETRLYVLDLQRQQAHPHTVLDAAHQGMTLSRPMLDKRLVEFGLAIPLELIVVGGRERYLARRALADLLPPSLQTKTAGQEALMPVVHESLRALLPQMRADVERMRGNEQLEQWFDLDRMAEDLAGEPEEVFPEGRSAYLATAHASARYVAWVNRLNC